jgi:radical SAM superfamily enzyme YgiQ (UPF0313 family)
MNYLLVMPKSLASIEHFNIFPIGLAYVSASLKSRGYNVSTANLDYLDGDTYSILKKLLTDNHIDVICTGGLSRDYHKLKEVIEMARSVNPQIVTVVGGGIISSDPRTAMRALDADIGVIGEGEITACELAHALDEGQSYSDVPGLIFKNGNNGLVVTASRNEIKDIDSIPLPDFDGFDYGKWVLSSGSGLVLTDRSCPFRCTFCFHPTGEKYRHRSFDSIFREIDFQIEKYQVGCFGLTSELFATTKRRVVEFCDRIKPYGISWSCCLRVCDVDAEMLQLMKAAGCVNVVFGLESADNTILKSMRKGICVEQISRALKLTYEANLMIEGGFIFGDINETGETVANTLNYWRQNNDMHYLNLSMISVLPGSFLYKHACDTGIIEDQEKFLRDGCPLVNVSKLTDDEYGGLKSKITELRLHPHVPAKSIRIESIEPTGECDVEFACRKCGSLSKLKVWFWFGRETRCPSCGLTNFIDPFQQALHRQDAFFSQLPADPVIALWGAGGIYYKIIQKYGMLTSQRFVLLDANVAQHGLTVCGKEIHSPDIISQKNIKTVVVTALSRVDGISATLHSEYPSVSHVLIPAFDITEEGVVPVLKLIK